MARILWIEGKRAESPQFVSGVRKAGYQVEIVTSGKDALERLPAVDPDLVVLNAASMRTSGRRICRLLRMEANGIPLLVITDPDLDTSSTLDANIVLSLPFTNSQIIKPHKSTASW